MKLWELQEDMPAPSLPELRDMFVKYAEAMQEGHDATMRWLAGSKRRLRIHIGAAIGVLLPLGNVLATWAQYDDWLHPVLAALLGAGIVMSLVMAWREWRNQKVALHLTREGPPIIEWIRQRAQELERYDR